MEFEKSPLSFFENLLEFDKYDLMKKEFVNNYIENVGSPQSIDLENGIIDDGEEKYSFSTNFNIKVEQQGLIAKRDIGIIIETIISKNENPKSFLEIQNNRLNTLLFKTDVLYPNHPIVKEVISKLVEYISKFLNASTKDEASKLITLEESSALSYNWDSNDNEDKLRAIDKLYKLLIEEPAIIECDKQDFVNAFSQRKVYRGINWNMKGKNKSVSKTTIVHFVKSLLNENFINDFPESDFKRKLEYIFRDNEGQKLNNVSNSMDSYNKNTAPFGYERIDIILDKLYQTD